MGYSKESKKESLSSSKSRLPEMEMSEMSEKGSGAVPWDLMNLVEDSFGMSRDSDSETGGAT